jgi:hypothetical protein
MDQIVRSHAQLVRCPGGQVRLPHQLPNLGVAHFWLRDSTDEQSLERRA